MTLYYFAYGSNLDGAQMQERCPGAEPAGIAHLHDHTLAFGGHSPHWDGSPATVVERKGVHVPGGLYRISFEELRVLDHYEGHPVRYERYEKRVVEPAGDHREAHVYVKEVDGNFGTPPESYISVLREAYRELGFDQSHLERALELGG